MSKLKSPHLSTSQARATAGAVTTNTYIIQPRPVKGKGKFKKMKKKIMWIRLADESCAQEAAQYIMNLNEMLRGNVPVRLYSESTKRFKTLPCLWGVSEFARSVLVEKYGDSNVKLTESEEAEENTSYSPEPEETEPLERMARQLERIADGLEDIVAILDLYRDPGREALRVSVTK